MKPTPSCDLYVDGASRGNPGPSGIGVVVMDGARKPAATLSRYLGETTNNVAEYLALIYGLQEAQRRGCRAVTVRTDSELLARQFAGQYRVRDPQLKLLHDLARFLAEGFTRCTVQHVPREQNTLADRLASQAVAKRPVASAGARKMARPEEPTLFES